MTSLTHTSSASADMTSVVAQNTSHKLTDGQNLHAQADFIQHINRQHTQPHLPVSELAARWAVSPASIYRMIDGQELGHLRVRGAIRIPHQVVLEYEAQQIAASTNQVEAA